MSVKNKTEGNKLTSYRKNMIMCGWLFIAPLLIGLILFVAFPLIYAIFLGFCEYDLFNPPKFIGLKNFVEMFTDKYFLKSMLNALIFCLNVPIKLVISLVLASILAGKIKGSNAFRLIFYVPCLFGAVAITFIWQWLLAYEYGLVFNVMKSLGLEAVNFLDKEHFRSSMIMISVWCGIGISVLLLYATIKNTPKSLYEAAEIDGANAVERFWHITIPAVSPIMFYVILTGIIGSFQEFTMFNVMSGDSVNDVNIMPVWWIYKFTGQYGYRYGYASALGLVLGVLLIIISAVQFYISNKWVHYD